MNQWTNESMNEWKWTNEDAAVEHCPSNNLIQWKNEWINELMTEWINERMNQWMNENERMKMLR